MDVDVVAAAVTQTLIKKGLLLPQTAGLYNIICNDESKERAH